MLRINTLKYCFCQYIPCTQHQAIRIRNQNIWINKQYEQDTKVEEVEMPQSVLTQRLKFIVNRNEFIKELSNFSIHSLPTQYYKKALYDISNFIEYQQLGVQINLDEQQTILFGLKLQQKFSVEQINLIKFHFQQQNSVVMASFLDASISLIKQMNQFQDLLFVNVVHNLYELFYDVHKRTKIVDEKFKELFTEIGILFSKFDHLSNSEPVCIATIIGTLNDLMIQNQIKIPDLIHYHKTANSFIHKFYEIKHNKLVTLNINDYKNFLYSLFLSEIKPEGLMNEVVNKFANQGIQYGSFAYLIEIMSMMLLYKIPCTEGFLEKLKQSKRGKATIMQLFIILKSYEFAKIPLYEYNTVLFQDLIYHVAQEKSLQDANLLLMFVRICNEIFSGQFITSKNAVEKRNDKLLVYVDKNVYKYQKQLNFNHLIFISNVFNKHLKYPNFLIDLLQQRIEDINITQQSLSLYIDFIDTAYEFFQQNYSNFSTTMPQTYIYPTNQYKNIIRNIVQQLLEYVGESAPSLLKIISLELFEFKREIVLKVLEKQQLLINDINLICKVMFNYNIECNEIIINQLKQDNIDQIQICESLYFIAKNQSFNNFKQDLIQISTKIITQLVIENEIYLVEKREVDDFIHTYSQQINIPTFKAFQFIPKLLQTFELKFDKQFLEILQKLFLRICPTWYGDILIENLIILSELHINEYQIYTLCSENLLTCFDYEKDTYQFWSVGLMADEKYQLKLLKSYFYQIEQLSQQQRQNMTFKESVKLIGYLAYYNFSKLNQVDLKSLCKILGSNQQMYYEDLFYQIQHYQSFNISNDILIQFISQYCIQNNTLQQKLIQYLKDNNNNIEISEELLIAAQNQCIELYNIDNQFLNLSQNQKQQLIQPILVYLLNCWTLQYPINHILNYLNNNLQQLNFEEQCIYFILKFFNKNKNNFEIKFINNCIFSINSQLIEEDDEFKEQFLKLLLQIDIQNLQRCKISDSYLYYPSIKVDNDQNNESIYKISQIKKKKDDDKKSEDKLLKFLTNQINVETVQLKHQILDFLINITEFYDIDLTSICEYEINPNKEMKFNLLKKDDDYMSFIVNITLLLQNQENIEYNSNIKHLFSPYMSYKIAYEQKNIILQYCAQNDLIVNSNSIYLTPQKILQQLALKEHGNVYVINFNQWKQIYNTKQKQKECIFDLLK